MKGGQHLRRVAASGLAVILTACGPSEPSLLSLGNTNAGPDEFAIVPARPLQAPPETDALPPPVLGARNRADPDPQADAVAALGGDSDALARQGVPNADGGLVNHASRFGRDPQIRGTLAEEDLDHRRNNRGRLLERIFNQNRYYDAYSRQQLDQQDELDRFRRSGVQTPAAPPRELKPE